MIPKLLTLVVEAPPCPLRVTCNFLFFLVIRQGIIAILIRIIVVVFRQVSGVFRFDLPLASNGELVVGDGFFFFVNSSQSCLAIGAVETSFGLILVAFTSLPVIAHSFHRRRRNAHKNIWMHKMHRSSNVLPFALIHP